MACVPITPTHDTPVMLFGFSQYANVWSGRARTTTDLAHWVHVPAMNLAGLLDTLSQFPRLEILVMDIFNETLKELNPLDLSSSLDESISVFYNHLEKAFEILPKMKVIWLFILCT